MGITTVCDGCSEEFSIDETKECVCGSVVCEECHEHYHYECEEEDDI